MHISSCTGVMLGAFDNLERVELVGGHIEVSHQPARQM